MAPRRLRIAVLALAGLCVLTSGCRPRPEKAETPVAPAPPAPARPTASPALGRAEIVEAAAAAAAAYAGGKPEPERAKALAGRQFDLRLPFGCLGPGLEGTSVGYAYDEESKALRLAARPEIWTGTAWIRGLVGWPEAEAIEGFWLRRPWLLEETCPSWTAVAVAGETPELVRSPETLGLAQVFEEGGSRLLRRGARGYQATVRAEPEVVAKGFRLVLQGRVASPDARGPARCRSGGPDQRPVCLILVEFDRVAFETAAGDVLSEWRS
jgi:hypothetical protein